MSVVAREPRLERKEFRADFRLELKQVDEQTGDLILEGYASTFAEDRDSETMDPAAFNETLPSFLATNPMLLYQHESDWPIGSVLDAQVDGKGLRVRCVVTRPDEGEVPEVRTAYAKIKRGVLRTFSVGGYMWRELRGDFENPQIVIVKVELLEISVVSIPCNGTALFGATVKKALALEGVQPVLDAEITREVQEQLAQIVGVRKMTDAPLLAMGEDERRERYSEIAKLYERAGAVPPGLDEWNEVARRYEGMSAEERTSPEALLGMLPDAALVAQKLLGEVKRGRVLSSANESKIRAARKHLDDVLSTLGEQVDESAPDGEAKGDKPPKLRDGTASKSCKDCKHWEKTGEGAGGWCHRYNYPTGPDQVSDGFQGKKEAVAVERLALALKSAIADGDVPFAQEVAGALAARALGGEEEPEAGAGGNGGAAGAGAAGAGEGAEASLADLAAVPTSTKGVAVDLASSFPLGDRETPFDRVAAEGRIREKTGASDGPNKSYARCFLWQESGNDADGDGVPDNFGDYRFLVCDVVGGAIKIMPRGVFAAANVLSGGRGGTTIPEADQARMKSVVEKLYKRMADEFKDDSIVVPWASD